MEANLKKLLGSYTRIFTVVIELSEEQVSE